jgi:hypothetical protein
MSAQMNFQAQKLTKASAAQTSGVLRRRCDNCRKKKPILQRAAVREAADIGPTIVHEVLSSPGRPLDAATRTFMEPRFGHDFSRVRVHTDSRAAESADAVNALAYTVGRDVVFSNGQYAPQTDTGKRLLAHELAHTIQNVQIIEDTVNRLAISQPMDAAEQAANVAAAEVMWGQMPMLTSVTPAPRVYRQPRLLLSLPRSQLKAIGNRDINTIIDALPQQLFNGQSIVVKRAIADGVQSIFELAIKIIPGNPSITSTEAAKAGPEEVIRTAQAITYKIPIELFQSIPDPVMTLYHELIHVQLIIDRYLPKDQQSETYRKFSQRLEMANDPALLAVTGTTPNRKAVFNGFNDMRAWYKVYVFGSNLSLPPALDNGTDEERYRTLINEYFTNKEAQRAFNKPVQNSVLARRYARSVQAQFQAAAQGQGLFSSLVQARQRAQNSTTLQSDYDVTDKLGVALAELFDALDQQLQMIEKFKQAPPSAVPPGASNPYSRPIQIEGTEMRGETP